MVIKNQSVKRSYVTGVLTLHRTRGWPYVASWGHRLSGILLVLYLCLHVLTLSSLQTPETFVEKMATFTRFVPGFFDWFLAIPVIYHSLNGGRLILYEIYGLREDQILLRIVITGSLIYLLLLALFMVLGNQSVSPIFFWLQMIVFSLCLTIVTMKKLWHNKSSIFWKLQRVSAVFLFLLIPAHMLFMHLNPEIGRDVQVITERMGNVFIKGVDIALLITALYHAGYGVVSIISDYVSDKKIKNSCVAGIVLVAVLLALTGVKMTILL